ncbi:hypothetical protein YS40_149 [Thermus phage phiYS40]|uniref:hypothetical protein n=1 Tax=Thermus phage phiYS40 TaxID=407392 RepID=UPI0000E68A0B|nr:hypothetical protein YS40_149 [Thermus phage phiYS40]ABJ91543.1 hypothetical protein YS40_149 [Thermus phage phiYS40]BAK53667.1 hypothetical protein YSP_149 [Thermus phage phiYS40]
MIQISLSQANPLTTTLSGSTFDVNNVNYYNAGVIKEEDSGRTKIFIYGEDLQLVLSPKFIFLKISADKFLTHQDFCSSYSVDICDGFTINYLHGAEHISLIYIRGNILNILRFLFSLTHPIFTLNTTFNENYIHAKVAFEEGPIKIRTENIDAGSPYKKYCF